ncbi:YdhR family protein [Desulfopila inferna]|uniref:YdhR family protein n=1 Tax=Desulfopila inferna TaxID=468528 RepID=UPI00196370AF|nr:YdhR family protein [Desulfopila inferna]MBM9602889.1 YdhR family protein [Desulfopila inferna]
MIMVIVKFKLPKKITRYQALETFLGTAPKYRDLSGLIRKYYFVSEDRNTAGGVYLWKSREEADCVYTEEWKAFVRGKYGNDPMIEYLECPVVVDNISNEIISDTATHYCSWGESA